VPGSSVQGGCVALQEGQLLGLSHLELAPARGWGFLLVYFLPRGGLGCGVRGPCSDCSETSAVCSNLPARQSCWVARFAVFPVNIMTSRTSSGPRDSKETEGLVLLGACAHQKCHCFPSSPRLRVVPGKSGWPSGLFMLLSL
jgi:hypothetical protein